MKHVYEESQAGRSVIPGLRIPGLHLGDEMGLGKTREINWIFARHEIYSTKPHFDLAAKSSLPSVEGRDEEVRQKGRC